jgi:S-adenosylmethionine decarboxylase
MNKAKTFNDVLRKRLVIELITGDDIEHSKEFFESYLKDLSRELAMTPIMGPLVGTWAKDYKPSYHDGFEGIIMWAESGATLYVWEHFRAATVDIYTCKDFSIESAIHFTKKVFKPKKIAWKEIEPILTI